VIIVRGGGKLKLRRRLLVAAAPLTLIGALLGSAPAQALILRPSIVVTPSAGPLGTTFSFDLEWIYGGSVLGKGCANDFTYGVTDPNGTVIAQGVIPANTTDALGNVVTSSAAVAVNPPSPIGTYMIAGSGCDQFGGNQGSFEVTAPPAPPPDVLSLAPLSQSISLDNGASVVATLVDGTSHAPVSGTGLSFAVSGPNAGVTGSCMPVNCATDAMGQVTWTYAGTAEGHDTINVTAQGSTAGVAQTGVDWTPTVNGSVYAALGDSYSSGQGAYVYLDGTNIPGTNMCHRSKFAYGPRLDSDRSLGLMGFVACSGALTDDFYSYNHLFNQLPNGAIEPGQLCQMTSQGIDLGVIDPCAGDRLPVIGKNTRTVTLTIGGNDAGFVDVVSSCVFVKYGLFEPGQPGRNCAANADIASAARSRLLALSGVGAASIENRPIHSIAAVLSSIHQVAPNARVYIAGYPQLFQPTSLRKDCLVGAAIVNGQYGFDLKIAASDALWLDAEAAVLDGIIATAARRAGSWVTFVNPLPQFAGHGLCSKDPWIQTITADIVVDGTLTKTVTSTPESAHPTITGQQKGYEAAFIAAGIHP
jgi:hypothetical protein